MGRNLIEFSPAVDADAATDDAFNVPGTIKLDGCVFVEADNVQGHQDRELEAEGTVRLRVLVGEDGRPQDASIGTSSGDAGLDQAALDAVRHWRFEPAKRDGVPLRAWCIVPITFSLAD